MRSSHSFSTDVNEAYLAGQAAVQYAVEGKTDYMVAFERAEGPEYKCNIKLLNLSEVANTEKKVPLEWIKLTEQALQKTLLSMLFR